MTVENYITPNWPAPKHVHAYCTTRVGGISQGPFASFNLADHVEDDALSVNANREKLMGDLSLPAEPLWLTQTHSAQVIRASYANTDSIADACFTTRTNHVCTVMTADCLPILCCDEKGQHAAAIHAGWRGLLAGVIETTVNAMDVDSKSLLVYLGPAISQDNFVVSEVIKDQFIALDPHTRHAFKEVSRGHFAADLYAIARMRLAKLGIEQIFGGEFCTYDESDKFFSYRRENQTGRMASLIWLSE